MNGCKVREVWGTGVGRDFDGVVGRGLDGRMDRWTCAEKEMVV